MWRINYVLILLTVQSLQSELYESDPFFAEINVINAGHNDILPNITTNIVKNCLIKGQKIARKQYIRNERLPEQGIYLHRNSTGFFRFNTAKLSDNVKRMKKASSVIQKGLQVLLDKFGHRYTPNNFMKLVYKKQFKITGLYNEDATQKYKLKHFRTFDGSYNNLKNPNWGKAWASFTRMVPANYADGIKKPALSVLGEELPSARDISIKIFNPHVQPDTKFTLLASQIAQVIAHDTNFAVQDNVDGGPIRCLTDSGTMLPTLKRHSSCMVIPVLENDPIYGKQNMGNLPFVRTVTKPGDGVFLSPAEQINGVTSFLDCNFVYGNSKEASESLRAFKNGKLLESSRTYLPLTQSTFCDCRYGNESCYKAGDGRVNQNPHLVAMHVIFLREHNRIARELKKLNRYWNDEKIFQETRRIVIAIYQRIVYKEYLPLVLGKSFTKMLFISIDKNGFTEIYDNSINPGSINSMSIIFRCYHSTIPESVTCCNNSCHVLKQFKFSDYILRPSLCCNNYDGILNSFSCLAMMKMEAAATREVTDKLFKSYSKYGLDLLAIDIQRGRDHGIPSYNQFRRYCNLKKVTRFKELVSEMGLEAVKRLQRCYKHVNDIDLLVGGMLEKPIENTPFGPVILHILREQFYRLMVGDRYFYSNKNQTYPFTPEQLQQIEKSSIAQLICANANKIDRIQRWPFQLMSEKNPRVACSELPTIDLRPWRDVKIKK